MSRKGVKRPWADFTARESEGELFVGFGNEGQPVSAAAAPSNILRLSPLVSIIPLLLQFLFFFFLL